MIKKGNTSRTNLKSFTKLLSFLVCSVNNNRGTDLTYDIYDGVVILNDSIFFKNGPLLKFMFDEDFNCYAFDSDFITEDIEDGTYIDFILDIHNELI